MGGGGPMAAGDRSAVHVKPNAASPGPVADR